MDWLKFLASIVISTVLVKNLSERNFSKVLPIIFKYTNMLYIIIIEFIRVFIRTNLEEKLWSRRKVNIRNIVSYIEKPTDFKYLNIIRHFILELIIENNFQFVWRESACHVLWIEEFEN